MCQQLLFCCLVAVTFGYAKSSPIANANVTFSNVLGDAMVLQRAPATARVWGAVSGSSSLFVVLCAKDDAACESPLLNVSAIISGGLWHANLPPTGAGGPYDLRVFASDEAASGAPALASLVDVLFGEVILCSGQSNMVFSLSQNYNASLHIAAANATKYRESVRVFTAKPEHATEPQPQLVSVMQPWTPVTASSVGNPAAFSVFSAACWFAGKDLLDSETFGTTASGRPVPLGLITSAFGGTRVHSWSSPDALSHCNQSASYLSSATSLRSSSAQSANASLGTGNRDGKGEGADGDSNLWNAMINPFLPMHVGQILWLQGESDVNPSDDPRQMEPQRGAVYYACAINAMVEDWRRKWNLPLPFSFVQIAPWVGHEAATSINQLPALRAAQLAALDLPQSCVASAVDLGDPDPSTNPWDAVHFRDKAPLGPRLAACVAHTRTGNAVGVTPPLLYRAPQAQSARVTRANASASANACVGVGVEVAFDADVPTQGRLSLQAGTASKCPFDASQDPQNAAKCAGFELLWRNSNGSSAWVAARAQIAHDTGSVAVFANDCAQAETLGGADSTFAGVRYLWADWPTAQLYFSVPGSNSSLELPVLPFSLPVDVPGTN